MRTIILPAFDSWKIVEIWKVVERREGLVYKTRFLGCWRGDLPENHGLDITTASLSTGVTKGVTDIALDVFQDWNEVVRKYNA